MPFLSVEAEQVDAGRRRELAPQVRVVQEDRLLDVRDGGAQVGDVGAVLVRPVGQAVLELGGEPLGLAAGELERRVLGAMPVPQPGVVVAAQRAGVVLQLHQVNPPLADHQQVDLVPATVAVTELEVRPSAERVARRQEGLDDVQALGLVGELGRRDLGPALGCSGHEVTSRSRVCGASVAMAA